MKKVLMGTTALVVASVALANVATAEVSVSGSVSYFLTYKSGSKTLTDFYADDDAKTADEYKVNLNVQQLTWQSEVVFKGGGVTDAGLNYGAEAQLRAGIASVTTDEAFLYVGGDSWGKITIGHDDDALNRVGPDAGSIAVGLGHEWNNSRHDLAGSDDDAKIIYQTPSLNGFNAAVSLTPQLASGQGLAKSTGSSNVTIKNPFDDNDATNTKTTLATASNENAIAVGVNFGQDLGGGSFKIGGGARIESTTNRSGTTFAGVADGDSTGDVFGLQVGAIGTFDAFSVAAVFSTATVKTSVAAAKDVETTLTNIGATVAYDYGQGGVSASYLLNNTEIKDGLKTSSNSIVLDADYKLADGLVAQMEAALNSSDPNGGDDATPTGFLTDGPSNTIVGLGLVASF